MDKLLINLKVNMPKIKETKSNEVNAEDGKMRRSAQNVFHPYQKDKRQIFEKFVETQKLETKNIDQLLLKSNEQIMKAQQNIQEKIKKINNLQEILKEKQIQIDALKQELNTVQQQNLTIYEHNAEINQKYADLEVPYDQELKKLNEILDEQMNEIKQLKLQNLDLMEKFSTYREQHAYNNEQQKLHTVNLTNKIQEMEQSLQHTTAEYEQRQIEKQQELEKIQIEMDKLKKQFENDLAAAQAQLAFKDELIAKNIQEKAEIEQQKNKIIDELTYKIRKIENVFEHPVCSVSPKPGTSNVSVKIRKSFPLQTNRPQSQEDIQQANKENDILLIPNSNSSNLIGALSTSTTTATTTTTTVSTRNAATNNLKRNLVASNNNASNNTLEQRSSKSLLGAGGRIKRLRRSPPRRYVISASDFNDDNDSDEDYTPKATKTLNNNTAGSTRAKANSPDIEFVLSSSEHTSPMDAFDRLKRL